MRELARALTGLPQRLGRRPRPDALPLRPRAPRRRLQAHLRQAAGATAGRTACGSSSRHRQPPVVPGHKLWGYFIPTPPPRGDGAGARAAVPAHGREVRPLLERDPAPPAPLRPGPADGQAAGRPGRRACCAPSAAAIDTTAWAWLCDSAGQTLFVPPNVSGWDDTRWLDTATFRARWQMAQRDLPARRLDPDEQAARPGRPGRRSSRRAPRSGAHPPICGAHPRRARALRRARAGHRQRAAGSATPYPALIAERAADAGRRRPPTT